MSVSTGTTGILELHAVFIVPRTLADCGDPSSVNSSMSKLH